jgi:chemotaxis protein methyltransferase CheR
VIMKISDFELYRDLLQRNSGLSLTPEKSFILDSRLTPVARKWGYPTLEAMTLALRGVPDVALLDEVVEAMTTKDTSFFRDMTPFTALRDIVVPHLIKSKGRNRELRIWSAACSTGQEPYSIAMTLKEIEAQLKGWRVEIFATDISAQALTKARTADYTQFEVQRGLPVSSLMKNFHEMDNSWRLYDDIRNLVNFEQFNLLDPMDEFGAFDIIFCRNVLSYFDEKVRNNILGRLCECLNPNGFLILGQDENPGTRDTCLMALDGCGGFYGLEGGKYNLEPVKKAAS